MTQIDVGSTQLDVIDSGSGRVLLLVHGFPLDRTMWQAQIDGLADRFRVIAPDLRGFGLSSPIGPEAVSMADFADDLAAMLDRMGVSEPVVFCGLSMGGYIGWEFCRRHGGRLAGLIACDTRAVDDTPTVAKGRRMVARQVATEGTAAVTGPMVEKLFAATTLHERPELVESVKRVMFATAPDTVAAAQRGMADRADATSLLPTIEVPALVIGGADDPISPPKEMRLFAAAMPCARFVEIAGAGHLAPLERPEPVNRVIADFLFALPNFS